MQVRTIKFAALLLASSGALALSSALPVQSFPQWETLKGENEKNVMYDLNSLKVLPNGVKQIDTYASGLNVGRVVYISCPRWRWSIREDTDWEIIPPISHAEALAYKLCGKS